MAEDVASDSGVLANGHAGLKVLEKVDSGIHAQENVFLFLPNIIGMSIFS